MHRVRRGVRIRWAACRWQAGDLMAESLPTHAAVELELLCNLAARMSRQLPIRFQKAMRSGELATGCLHVSWRARPLSTRVVRASWQPARARIVERMCTRRACRGWRTRRRRLLQSACRVDGYCFVACGGSTCDRHRALGRSAAGSTRAHGGGRSKGLAWGIQLTFVRRSP